MTFEDPSQQCLQGTTGALCLVCAEGYVPGSAHNCEPCNGGANPGLAFVAMIGMICLPAFCDLSFSGF